MEKIISSFSLNFRYQKNNSIIKNFIDESNKILSDNLSLKEKSQNKLHEELFDDSFSNNVNDQELNSALSIIDRMLNCNYEIVLLKYIYRRRIILCLLFLTVFSSILYIVLKRVIDIYIICFFILELCLISLFITNSIIIKDWKKYSGK